MSIVMAITREHFESGKPFHFIKNMATRPYMFVKGINKESGEADAVNYFNRNECNVISVTKSYFDAYTTVCGRVLKARIYFKNLYP